MTGARRLDNRRFASSAPGAAGVMIGPDVRGVPEIYISTLFLSHFLDFRIIFLQPLLNQSLVPFLRTMQRLLAGINPFISNSIFCLTA